MCYDAYMAKDSHSPQSLPVIVHRYRVYIFGLCVLIVLGAVYILTTRSEVAVPSTNNKVVQQATSTFPEWNTYKNDTYGYSLRYPSDWKTMRAGDSISEVEGIAFYPPGDGFAYENSIVLRHIMPPKGVDHIALFQDEYRAYVVERKKQGILSNAEEAISFTGVAGPGWSGTYFVYHVPCCARPTAYFSNGKEVFELVYHFDSDHESVRTSEEWKLFSRVVNEFQFQPNGLRSIRDVRFIELLMNEFEQSCRANGILPEEGNVPITLDRIEYIDITGDGNEEAIIKGWSCFSGTGGADVLRVYTMSDTKIPTALSIDDLEFQLNGVDYAEGIRGHMNIVINTTDLHDAGIGESDGLLVKKFSLYDEKDPNCCPTRGMRVFKYRWDGKQFVLFKAVDQPAP